MSRMITYNQRLPEELLEALDKELYFERGSRLKKRSRSALVREMLEMEIARRQAERDARYAGADE